ncbi:PP28 domain-containing protein [Citrus sinensis]|uniref:PP28 domain-containing protein n=1 Tax=Citrus sinensis TaxID=2711 RepID=A0ACB8NHI7_CITSI|nr:PP28 domain-containing protein [Citrus sinensis]
MGRGKFKGKPTGQRQFSTPEDILAGTSRRPRTFKREQAEHVEEVSEDEAAGEESGEESGEELEEKSERRKGTQGLIEINNPNLVKAKNLKAKDVDFGKTTELSRREREELEKQRAHERYMQLQEQGKTEKARLDLERLALIRQQRAEAAKKREEEKAESGHTSTKFSNHKVRYPNPPDAANPDPATLREQWRFAIKQYSRWYSHAWGTAIFAGLSFFALGWIVKGSNPLPSFKGDSNDAASHDSDGHKAK